MWKTILPFRIISRASRTPWALLAVVMSLGAPAQPAGAATVLALDLAGLVERADVIVLGRAKSRSGRWSKSGKVILTDVELAVERTLKGSAVPGKSLRVTRLGGDVAGEEIALAVPGAATFALGQRVVTFLRRAGDDLRVVGMAQGVIVVDGNGPDAMASQGSAGPSLVVPSDPAEGKPGAQGSAKGRVGAQARVTKPAMATPTPLSKLLAEIAALVEHGTR